MGGQAANHIHHCALFIAKNLHLWVAEFSKAVPPLRIRAYRGSIHSIQYLVYDDMWTIGLPLASSNDHTQTSYFWDGVFVCDV